MADKNLGIRLISKLDRKKSIEQINKDLSYLQKNLSKLDLNIDVKGLTKDLQTQLKKLNTKDKTIPIDIDSDNLKKDFKIVSDTVEGLKKEFGATTAGIQKNIDATNGELKDFLVTLKKTGAETQKIRLVPTEDKNGKPTLQAQELKVINNLEEENLKLAQQMAKFREQSLERRNKEEKKLAETQAKTANKNMELDKKQLQQEKKKSEELEYQVKKAQELAKYKRQDLERRYGTVLTADQNKALDDYINNMNRITKDTPNARRQIDQLNTSFKGIESQIKATGTKVNSFGSNLKEAISRIPVWMIGMTAFYAPLRSIQDAIDQIIELDSQMVVLDRVSNGMININEVMEASIDIADRLGNTISEVNDGLINFARQGFRGDDLIAITEIANVMGNVSDLSVEDSASALTAAMKGFNIEAQDAIRIVNSLNEVDNNYSITTTQLAEALQRSAGAASTYGVEMEKAIGYATAIGEVTRESGSVIGNSLKSIYSRITSIQPAIDSLSEIGVHVKNASGEMRNVDDILSDLSGKWQHLNSEQKQNLGLQIAGRFQLSRFLVLMDNFNQATSASESAVNSHGSAMRENEKYLESYEAKVNKVKNSWTEAALEMQESFLGDAILGFTDVSTNLIRTFTRLIDEVGLLPVAFGTATTAVMLFNNTLRTTSMSRGKDTITFLKNLPKLLRTTGASATTASVGMKSFSSASVMATTALKGLRVAAVSTITFLAGALLPIAGFMALGAAISFVTQKITENKKRNEEWQKANEQSVKSIQSERENIDKLVKSYEKLRDLGSNRTNEQEEEYVQLQNELGQLLPAIVVGEDEKGNKILANSDIIKDHVELLKEQLAYEKELATQEAPDTIRNNRSRIDEIKEQLAEEEKELERLRKMRLNDEYEDAFPIIDSQIEKTTQKMNDLYAEQSENTIEIKNAYQALAEEIDGLNSSDAEWIAQQASDANLAHIEFDRLTIKMVDLKKKIGEGFSFDAFDASQLDEIQKVTNQVQSGSTNWEQFSNTLTDADMSAEQVNQTLGYLRNTEDELARSAKVAGVSLETHTPVFKELGSEIEWVETATGEYDATLEDNIGTTEEAKSAQEQLADAYSTTSSEIEPLNKLLYDLSQGKKLTATEAMELISKEHELANAISIESGEVVVNEQAVRSLRDAKISGYSDMIQSVVAEAQQTANATISNVRNYGIEIQAIQSLQDAKRRMLDIDIQRSRLMRSSGVLSPDPNAYSAELSVLNQARDQVRNVYDLYTQVQSLQSMAGSAMPHIGLPSASSSSPSSGRGSSGSSGSSSNRAAEQALREREKLADEYIRILEDSYKKRIELLEKERDKELQMLDERAQAYSDYVDEKLKQLDRERDEDNYRENEQGLMDRQSELQRQIDIASLNTSQQGSARRLELEKELTKVSENLAKLRNDRSYDLQRQNLQDQKDAFQEETEAKKSAIEQQFDEQVHYYNEMLNNEKHFADLRQQVINGNMKKFKSTVKSQLDALKKYNKSVVTDMESSWTSLVSLMNRISGVSGGLSSSSSSNKSSSNKTHTVRAGDTLSEIANKYYGSPYKWSKISEANDGIDPSRLQIGQKLIIPYHEGGIVGSTPNGKITQLINKLFNVDPNSEQLTKQLVGELNIPPKNIPNIVTTMKNISSLSPSLAGGGNVDKSFNLTVNYQGGSTRKEAESFGDFVIDYMKERGKY